MVNRQATLLMGQFCKHSVTTLPGVIGWSLEVLWVETAAFLGPDRRLRRSRPRLFNRRHTPDVAEPLTLVAALRHLRVRVGAADDSIGLDAFCRRARAVALLANGYGNRSVGDVLMGLVRRLESPSASRQDPRREIFAELERVGALCPHALQTQ